MIFNIIPAKDCRFYKDGFECWFIYYSSYKLSFVLGLFDKGVQKNILNAF